MRGERKREKDEGGNSRRHGKLPDERSESYEIWPPCGEALACVPRCRYGWRPACKGTSSEFGVRKMESGKGERKRGGKEIYSIPELRSRKLC